MTPTDLDHFLHPPKEGDEFEVTLTSWAYGGEVVGRLPDGRAVFVPYAIPGEVVRVRLTEVKPRYARAQVVTLIEPAPDRVAPRCPHFGRCGGCHYQHLDYAAQLTAKTAIVRDQLQRIGGLSEVPLRPAVPSPHPWGYRNHVQFHLDEEGRLGFQAWRSHQVVPIETCFLPVEPIAAVWPNLQLDPEAGITRVHLRAGAGDELLLVLRGRSPRPPAFAVDFPLLAVYLPEGDEAEPVVLAGHSYQVMEVKGRPFRVSAGSFFQVNTPVAGAMVDHLLEHLPLGPEVTLLEVYAGVGLFSAFLAPRVGRLLAIEASPSACADFEVNLDAFDHVELYEAPAEVALPYLVERDEYIQVALVDPPRGGLPGEVLDALVALAPEVIAYVSCDVATLARDARRLTRQGYRLRQITPFDMFPQTYHIETVSFWERR